MAASVPPRMDSCRGGAIIAAVVLVLVVWTLARPLGSR